MDIGLTLPNRAIQFGATTIEQLLEMAERADRGEAFRSVWAGDSLLGKPRLESVAFLSAVAARTTRVRLGTACMASFVLRDPVWLAYQWASLDQIARGRTVLVVCTGLVEQEGGKVEAKLYNLQPRDRVRRLIEWIEIVRKLWTEDNVSYAGEYYSFEGVTISPKPFAQPRPPIWIASNAQGARETLETIHRRIVARSDGWQTSICDPADLAWRMDDIRTKATERGKDPAGIVTHIYHNININEDRAEALSEAKRFLDTYYMKTWTEEHVACWTAAGSVEECVAHLAEFKKLGVDEVTLRIASWDQTGQLERLVNEVIPALQAA